MRSTVCASAVMAALAVIPLTAAAQPGRDAGLRVEMGGDATEAMPEQSATEVAGGSRLVAEAANKLETTLGVAAESLALIGSIATTGREQASSIEEVSTAVRLMDEMTQHNAALVEETNAAIEQTEAQASELDGIAEFFKLADNYEGAPAAASVRRSTPGKAAAVPQPASKPLRTVGNVALKEEWEAF